MKRFFLLIPVITIFFIASCRKDNISSDPSAKLEFSRDTIFFDTVFTTIGSSTQLFKVFNRNSESVVISQIRLAGGSTSPFRLNIDGISDWHAEDVEIRKRDSMFVFAEVTVDPNNSNNPLLVRDSVEFVTNGNHQWVILEAIGQDVYLHYPTNITSEGVAYSFLDCRNAWVNDKPHVIFGLAIIPSGQTLTMMPGTRVHLHKSAILAADSGATLNITGSQASMVTIQGDRTEDEYKEEPGQWGYIWLSGLSENNNIDWALIKNGYIGIKVDTAASTNPTLHISNSEIRNMVLYGMLGVSESRIRGNNLLIHNCGEYCFAGAYGGTFSFTHCTFANYWDFSSREKPAILLSNWYEVSPGDNQYRNLDSANFYNCVVYGTLDNEFALDSNMTGGTNFRYHFENCLIKTNQNTPASRFINCVYNSNPMYDQTGIPNGYHPQLGSPLINAGAVAYGQLVPIDFNGNNRTLDAAPDIGCYEYHP